MKVVNLKIIIGNVAHQEGVNEEVAKIFLVSTVNGKLFRDNYLYKLLGIYK